MLRLRRKCQKSGASRELYQALYAALIPRPVEVWQQAESILFAVDPIQQYQIKEKRGLKSAQTLIKKVLKDHNKGSRPQLPVELVLCIPASPFVKIFDLPCCDQRTAILFGMWADHGTRTDNRSVREARSVVTRCIRQGWLLPASTHGHQDDSSCRPGAQESVKLCRGFEKWYSSDECAGVSLDQVTSLHANSTLSLCSIATWIVTVLATSDTDNESRFVSSCIGDAQKDAAAEYIAAMMCQLASTVLNTTQGQQSLKQLLSPLLMLLEVLPGGRVFASQCEQVYTQPHESLNLHTAPHIDSVWHWSVLEHAMAVCLLTLTTRCIHWNRPMKHGNLEHTALQLLTYVV
jgi:hypothetical protein